MTETYLFDQVEILDTDDGAQTPSFQDWLEWCEGDEARAATMHSFQGDIEQKPLGLAAWSDFFEKTHQLANLTDQARALLSWSSGLGTSADGAALSSSLGGQNALLARRPR